LVLIFYRGGWCPFCNKHLGQLQQAEPQLRELGYRIVAVSPDRPEKLKESTDKGGLSYTLLSDSSMVAAQAFGIAFEVDAPMLEKLASYNIDIEADSGETHHLLPVPAVFIVGKDGVIDFSYANPDYKTRLASEVLLAAAKAAL
jgi:peroxiredoxin